VEVVATEASLTFFHPEEIEETGARVWRNQDEWSVSVCQALTVF
jgi:phosphopantothenoylcysteine decarboxylase